MNINITNITTKSALCTAYGLPLTSGLLKLEWYLNGRLVETTVRPIGSTVTRMARMYKGLYPFSSYTITVKAYYKGALVGSATESILTEQEVVDITALYRKTSVKLEVSGLAYAPSYERTVKLFYKEYNAANYTLVATMPCSTGSLTYVINKLRAGTKYTAKVEVYNGTSLIATDNVTFTTQNASGTITCPTPYIDDVSQVLSPSENYVYARVKCNADAWIAGTTVEIRVSINNGAYTLLNTDHAEKVFEDVFELELPEGNDEIYVQFRYTTRRNGTVKSYTYPSVMLRRHFAWDSVKIQGNMLDILASEWRGLCEYAEYVGEILNHGINVDRVLRGYVITANDFSEVSAAIAELNPDYTAVVKSPGQIITASDVNGLVEAINNVEGG